VTDEPPKIVFPCRYPIKVLGRAGESFHTTVLAIFQRHASGFEEGDVIVKDSRKGTFQSITVTIMAQDEEQLRLIHEDLMATGLVTMVM
jgi:uncharacterized protein